MLSLAKFPTQVQCDVHLYNPIPQNPQCPTKSHFLFPIHAHFTAGVIRRMRKGSGCNALKTRKKGDFSYAEMGGPDESKDDVEFDDDDVFIPLQNMKEWLENRPRGFGEGRVYDTSIEDKLMEEIEQSRKAQLANVNKLKNNPVKPLAEKETSNGDKGSPHVEDGFRVRLVNLPKKKNIHRDLKLAFTRVPGILGVKPVVSGNEKTRDPVCKGLAFVHFKSKEDAQSFVRNFSGKNISFGKVEKQIKCEMMNAKEPDIDASLLDPWDENQNDSSEIDDAGDTNFSAQLYDDDDDDNNGEVKGTLTTSDSNLAKGTLERGQESPVNSSAAKQGRKLKIKDKKGTSKARKDSIPKLNIPGSAKRLKIREKNALAGAFTKYGAKAAGVKDQSR